MMNKYIEFLENYSTNQNDYIWFKKCHYGIQGYDKNNYYIQGKNMKKYPLPKILENTKYNIIIPQIDYKN